MPRLTIQGICKAFVARNKSCTQPIPILFLKIFPAFTIRSAKRICGSNTNCFEKLTKIGQYLGSVLGKSRYI